MRIFYWDKPFKDFAQYLRTRRNLFSIKPSRVLWILADLGVKIKTTFKTKILDRLISKENQKEIRWHYIQVKWRGVEKPYKFLVVNPWFELFHFFFAKHMRTIFRYYCQSYVFMTWFYAVFAVKLYYLGFTDTPSKVDALIYVFFFWNFCFYYIFRRMAWVVERGAEYTRYVLYQTCNAVLYIKFFVGDIIYFLDNKVYSYEDNIAHSEYMLDPLYWLDRYIPLFTLERWEYYLEFHYAYSVIWVPFFIFLAVLVMHFIDDWRDGIVYFKTRYFGSFYEQPRFYWSAIKREFKRFYENTFLLFVNTGGMGILYYCVLFVLCGPVFQSFSAVFVLKSIAVGFWIITAKGRLLMFFVLSLLAFKIFIRFLDPHREATMADVWKMYRRRYDLYSPSRTAVNSIFIYGIPLYITMYGENLIIGEAYKKFFIEPDYVESWLVVFIAFFAVGVVSAAYRGDKRYAALYAMNCSGSLTLLFVGLAVYYRTMSIIPSSEIAGARYVLFDLAKYFHNQYYTEFLIWGYDYVTLVMCIMSSTVFTVTFYLMIDSEEAKVEWVVLWLLLAEFFVIGAFLSLNLMSFFMLFEALTIPFVAVLISSGSTIKKKFAAKQLAIYSLVGGAPMLVATLYLYAVFKTTNIMFITQYISFLTWNERVAIFFALLIAFAVKTPLFPFHSWLLNAHVEAPTAGSIILASVLLKLGVYGILRFVLGLFPDAVAEYNYLIIAFAIFGLFYSSMCAATETDCKRIIALSSIGHMSLTVAGIFICEPKAIYGAIYMMIGHAITSLGLFFMIGILYSRTGTRDISMYGGLSTVMPVFSTILFIFIMFNSGFPVSISFLGELHLMTALMQGLSLPATFIIIVSSCVHLYSQLRLFYALCFGSPSPYKVVPTTTDLDFQEVFVLVTALLSALTLFFFSCHFFWPFEMGYLGEYLYSAEQALYGAKSGLPRNLSKFYH